MNPTGHPEICKLRAQQEALQLRLDAIKKSYRRGLSADLKEQAIQLENMEVLEEIARITTENLRQVEQNLREVSNF